MTTTTKREDAERDAERVHQYVWGYIVKGKKSGHPWQTQRLTSSTGTGNEKPRSMERRERDTQGEGEEEAHDNTEGDGHSESEGGKGEESRSKVSPRTSKDQGVVGQG